MKNVSKWLLAGSVLALAFACQPNQQNQNRQNQNGGGCGQPKCAPEKCEPPKEKPCPKPVCEPKNKSCGAAATPVEKSAPSTNPEAEKIAAPISVSAIRVAQQEAPLAKEKAADTAVSSAPPAPAPAPETKNSVSSSAQVKPAVPAVKDQSSTTSVSK